MSDTRLPVFIHFSLSLLSILFICSCSTLHKEIASHREHARQDFLTDPRSPLQEADFIYLDYYKPVKEAVVHATFTLTPNSEPFDLPTYSGITRSYRQWGIAAFLWKGQRDSLSLYENMTQRSNPVYADYLFLPFKDETNGANTYGGGRYINMSKKDTEDGMIIIDFNKCYNPWCAYSDGFNCPIPPKENHLPFAVKAGEKNYKGEHKKVRE